MGFELVYQSRASRGAFDLMALRGGQALGIQVKRTTMPLRFSLDAWHRMESEAARLGWSWVLANVHDSKVNFLDPNQARVKKTARVHAEAAIDNLLAWVQAQLD